MNCKDCQYWFKEVTAKLGECHRYPPATPRAGGFGFPFVREKDFCGDFAAIKVEVPKPVEPPKPEPIKVEPPKAAEKIESPVLKKDSDANATRKGSRKGNHYGYIRK